MNRLLTMRYYEQVINNAIYQKKKRKERFNPL